VAGGDWLRRATASAVTLCADRAESEDSLGVLLLGDLRQVFAASGADRLSTEEILSHLVALDERPWSDYRRGKAITSRQLAGLLKSFGVRSGTIRLDGGRTPKGYCLRDLEEVFERYVPS
jgi:hypothetical protein